VKAASVTVNTAEAAQDTTNPNFNLRASILSMAARKTFVVEHLDPELGPWSALEYTAIAKESKSAECDFILSSVPKSLLESSDLQGVGAQTRAESVEDYFSDRKDRICLLDPQAKHELSPSDGEAFDIFLFGGILGDDPPRDRTCELRKKGFTGRRLGPKQMTTDTAVRVTRMVVLEGKELDSIPYVDFPELKLNEHESTEMPFRYVVDDKQEPIMPEGMFELIKADADKGFDQLDFADEVDGMDDLKV
jgi:ribosome biogenesis SPOUT family RNA methylase Rps3